MNLDKLNSRNPEICRVYIETKFKSFSGPLYSKQRRREKCQDYYVAAAAGDHGQAIIEEAYPRIFKNELFDIHAAKARAKRALERKPERVMLESGAYFDNQAEHGEQMEGLLRELKLDLENRNYELGPAYFKNLKIKMLLVDPTVCDQSGFVTEFQQQCKAALSSRVVHSRSEAEANFDLMVGFTQNAAIRFETRSANWGAINAKLEESFTAGLWASGNAKASWKGLGFSSELEAAIAIGALLDLNGELTWTKGSSGIRLGGKCEAFAGGRAKVSGKLSVNARKGFEAAIAAGAFAGVEFKAEGACAFEYDGKALVSAAGSASVTFGAGAEFSAGISAQLFGPTTFAIESNVTLGMGAATSVNVSVDFDQLALASSDGFRTMVYWRTMARGYEATLMESDAKNLHYLKKCIARLEADIADTDDLVNSYKNTPMEKRSLLMAV